MIASAVAVIVGLLAVWWYLLRARLVPVLCMRVWFLSVNVVVIFSLSALTWLVDVALQLVRAPKWWTECMSVVVLTVAFRMVCFLNPQIRIFMSFGYEPNGKRVCLASLGRRAAIVANHTSFWDVYVPLAQIPLRTLLYTRTYMKASLRDIPIFGPTLDRVGQFPVHFKSDEDGNFHVDREKQAKVHVDVVTHVSAGGNLAFFPEGQLNKHPEILQPFRYGTFSTIIENNMRMLYAVMVGNNDVWPLNTIMGGFPGDCYVHVGYYEMDYEHLSAKAVAEAVQVRMQEVHTRMVADIAAGKMPE